MTGFRLFCLGVLLALLACGQNGGGEIQITETDMGRDGADAQIATDLGFEGDSGAVADAEPVQLDAEVLPIEDATVSSDATAEASDTEVAQADGGQMATDASPSAPDAMQTDSDAMMPTADAAAPLPDAGIPSPDIDTCVPTGAEACNDADDDCDGEVDEELMDVGSPCDVPGERGQCRQGSYQCNGGVRSCVRFYTPTAEECNGLDDDCDGNEDNGIAWMGTDCSTGLDGLCRTGTLDCLASAPQLGGTCVPNIAPNTQDEVCNGFDDDCDGSEDEGFNIGLSCSETNGVCDFDGVQVCNQNGEVVCEPSANSDCAELCNGIDDNLNGSVDENVPPGAICEAGVGACIRQGRLRCTNGGTPQAEMLCDAIPGLGSREICNGITDDCDDAVDENVQEVGQPCSTGVNNACGPGLYDCQSGTLVCIPNLQQGDQAEVFNCIDDDCDGAVDEDAPGVGGVCNVGSGRGQCAFGTRQCVNGAVSCVGNDPSNEVCNNLDDDCNGAIDDFPVDVNDQCDVGLPEDVAGSNVCNLGFTQCIAGALSCESSVVPICEIENSSRDEDCDGVTDEARDRFCGEAELALERDCIGVAPYTTLGGDAGFHLGVRHVTSSDGDVHLSRASNAGTLGYTRLGAGEVETSHLVIGAPLQGTRGTAITLQNNRPVLAFTLPRGYGPVVVKADRDRPTSEEHWTYEQLDADSWVSNDIAITVFQGTLRLFYRRITDTVCEENRRSLGAEATVFACASSLMMVEQQNNGTWTSRVINGNGASGLDVTVAHTNDGHLFVAHTDALNGNLQVEHYANGSWGRHSEPVARPVGNRPNATGTTGLRPSIAIVGDEVEVVHGPQMGRELDDGWDSGILYITTYQISTNSWVSFSSLGFLPGAVGGGHAIANLDDRAWIFTRERSRRGGPIPIDYDSLYLARYSEPRFEYPLETYSQAVTRQLFTNLTASADPFGLPLLMFSSQPSLNPFASQCFQFGNLPPSCAAPFVCDVGSNRCYEPERVCFYRPIDTDGDRVPDYEENERGTNPDIADTDGDGRSDGEEILIDGTNPLQ